MTLLKNAPNPLGVLGSKGKITVNKVQAFYSLSDRQIFPCFSAVGEPPQCMSCSCLFAVQDAIYHAREESGQGKEYFALDGPATVEVTQLKCLVDSSQFII